MSSIGLFSRGAVLLAFCMALTPAVFSAGPYLESRFFPVTRNTEILNEESLASGTSFYVRFQKVRQCEFQALVWYDGNLRVSVDFEPTAELAPRSRPPGGQFAGPWFIPGLEETTGSHAYVYHRCHPLWTTITRFYRS